MRHYRIVQIEAPRHPVVRVTFDDGLVGELDLQQYVGRGPYFAPLTDVDFFRSVSIGKNGRYFGWRLDEAGHEIDFGADSARAEIETGLVEKRAERYRHSRAQAAE